MANSALSDFSAAPSLLGYLYQVRVALLWALRQSRMGDFRVSLELLDDVSFSQSGDPIAVIQTKHSTNAVSNLSDLSPEVWKTLRVWIVGTSTGEISDSVAKFLVSTGIAKNGTACGALRLEGGGRDVAAASNLLVHAATTSTNAELEDVFDSFLALSAKKREQLLSRIYVLAEQPNAAEIDSNLAGELYYVSINHADLARQILEGWWFKRVIDELVNKGNGICRAEIDGEISNIQESLKHDHLPIDGEIDALMVALEKMPEFSNRPFYKQVEIVGAGQGRIQNAITSYLQAFRQRSSWTRNDLLFDADLRQYDQSLMNEWKLLRDQVCDELGDEPGEKKLAEAGRAILKWAEDASVPIKSGVSAAWVCRGSLHMLADDRKIGWHPEFEARLSAIFDTAVDKELEES